MRSAHAPLAAALFALCSCAAINRQAAADSEELLRQAGFQARPADTAERQQNLAQMPPRQIVAQRLGGGSVYAFADPDYCRCVYVGGDKEYAELQKLRQARLDEHEALVVRSQSDRSIRSQLWGPWEPGGLEVK